MRYWEEQVEFLKQIITHAKSEGVRELKLDYEHYGPSKGPLNVGLSVTFSKKALDKS